jgi:hypothetical protein
LSRFKLAAVVALLVTLACGQQAPLRPASIRSAVPDSRLEFGLASQPSDISWMVDSGVPWNYRYQYLSGGVNTGQDWATWNSPAGAFASGYMTDSGRHGYIPVFTYYELLQSKPGDGATEADKEYSNLNSPATMNAYYANFKLLMQMAGDYGRLVVVQVEPDFWGYMEQRAGGGDASAITAAVSSSGFADVGGIPDTLQGFAWALLHLRDLYAPKVALGIHASMWSAGIDIATNTSQNVDVVGQADALAAFLDSAGISPNPQRSTWDLVFNDLDDHDAAWWESQGSTNKSFTHWWDPTNRSYPNFSRYLAWVGELKAQTRRPQVAWQVPVGNQYFLTENNKCGHYQDNVAQYFLAHTADLFRAGLVAVLFGAGNECQTAYTDAQKDGVTNNNGVPTSDSGGRCNACNTRTSTWPDDDGGYLRIFVGEYYKNWQQAGRLPSASP